MGTRRPKVPLLEKALVRAVTQGRGGFPGRGAAVLRKAMPLQHTPFLRHKQGAKGNSKVSVRRSARTEVVDPVISDAVRHASRRRTGSRACLDHLIPLNERHLRQILSAWLPHYNHGRPHASLGPGTPEATALAVPRSATSFRADIASQPHQFSAAFITNTDSSWSPRRLLRSTPLLPACVEIFQVFS
jgi:Integrase core domain